MTTKVVFVILYVFTIWGVYRAVVDRNPVFSVLYLIFSFLALCSLLMYLSADYLAILLVLIYGGAISILIMFVIMLLDLKELELEVPPGHFFLKSLALSITALFVLLLLFASEPSISAAKPLEYKDLYKAFDSKTNIEVVGYVLYNYYTFQFIFVGFLLFVAMVIIISLVIRKQKSAKSQILFEQLKKKNLDMTK